VSGYLLQLPAGALRRHEFLIKPVPPRRIAVGHRATAIGRRSARRHTVGMPRGEQGSFYRLKLRKGGPAAALAAKRHA
jgi:hypothetical protein